jgi:Outer membrane protein beta-barrel domain
MRKIYAFSICLIIILSTGTASAFTYGIHTWEVGAEVSQITYKEPDINMKEDGIMYGIVGSYSYHKNYMMKVEGKFSYGQVDYSSRSGELNNIDDYMLEFRLLAGYDFPVGDMFVLTTFVGLGYRYLNDDSSGKITSLGYSGYDRESNYLYSPIGLTAVAGLKDRWTVGLTGEYDLFWWGKQKSHLGDARPGFPTVENDQTGGYGLRGSIIIQKQLDTVMINVEPFIRYWNINRSESEYFSYRGALYEVYEPKNESTEIGCKISLLF